MLQDKSRLFEANQPTVYYREGAYASLRKELPNLTMQIALWAEIHARPPHELLDLAKQLRAEEAGGEVHAVVVESMDNFPVALNDPPQGTGTTASSHANERPRGILDMNLMSLDQTKHQLEITGDSITRVESSELMI